MRWKNAKPSSPDHGKTLKPCSGKPDNKWKRILSKRLDKVALKGATQKTESLLNRRSQHHKSWLESDLRRFQGYSDDTVRKRVQELGKPSPEKKVLSIRQRSERKQARWRMRS